MKEEDLRDRLAGYALSGLLSGLSNLWIDGEDNRARLVQTAYLFADAMLEERDK